MKRILILAGIAIQMIFGAALISRSSEDAQVSGQACAWCGGCYPDVDPDCC